MKPTKEQVEAYKSVAKQSPQTMEGIIKSHLEQNCQKYAGYGIEGHMRTVFQEDVQGEERMTKFICTKCKNIVTNVTRN